jgi:hypothetical protein
LTAADADPAGTYYSSGPALTVVLADDADAADAAGFVASYVCTDTLPDYCPGPPGAFKRPQRFP